MPEQLLDRTDLPEAPTAPQEDWFPPAPPEGLDTVLYEHDDRAARADLRRQIAAMELALARLFGSAFPRKGIDFVVPGMGGPRLLSVDELEQVRDALAARVEQVRSDLHEYAVIEEGHRELIERMTANPASYKWVRVSNEDIGEPGCKHWHAKPRWGPLGILMSWWRVKISSGCPLAKGPRPPEWLDGDEATAPQAAALTRTSSRPPGSDALGAAEARRSSARSVGKLPAL